jgi:hypothetical protein
MILRSLVEQAYRLKARTAHPDAGGSNDAMIALNRARAQALDYCDGRDANGARP